MSWLRYARMLIPVIIQASDIAISLYESQQLQRRFLRTWMKRVVLLAEDVLVELQDQIGDDDVDTQHVERGDEE